MDISQELRSLSRSLGRVQAELEHLHNAPGPSTIQELDRCRELGQQEKRLELRIEELQRHQARVAMQQTRVALSRGAPPIRRQPTPYRQLLSIPASDTYKTYQDFTTPELLTMALPVILDALCVIKKPGKNESSFIALGGSDAELNARATAIRCTGLPGYRNAGLAMKIKSIRDILVARNVEPALCVLMHNLIKQTNFVNTDTSWAENHGVYGAPGSKLVIEDSTIMGAGKGVFLAVGSSVPPGTILTEVCGQLMTQAQVNALPDDHPSRRYMVDVNGMHVVQLPAGPPIPGSGVGMTVNHGGMLSNVHYVNIDQHFYIESSVFLQGPCELMSDYGEAYVQLHFV